MNSEVLREVDRWLATALRALRTKTPADEFVRDWLTDVRQRIARAAAASGTVERKRPRAFRNNRGARYAIDRAVAALYEQPTRLSSVEAVVLSKLLVVRSKLHAAGFDAVT